MKSAVRIWREKGERFKYLGRVGKIVSFTKIIHGPKGFSGQPYWVALVDFGKRKRWEAQLVGEREPKIKEKVIGVMRRLKIEGRAGVIEYGVKFKYV